jgi:L-ribulokinase
MNRRFALGLDFGTNSVRALIADTGSGDEIATHVWAYRRGEEGIILDDADPDLARQHPRDYTQGLVEAVRGALRDAAAAEGFSPDRIVGIGIDATGSTPIPVDPLGEPLAFQPGFDSNPDAMAWLWKDHTAHPEAAEITSRAAEHRPAYLAKCGGIYSPEWFWAKMLHCRRNSPGVFDVAHTWVELTDFVPALLTDNSHPDRIPRSQCTAGHKAMFHETWGGFPDAEFLKTLDENLVRVRSTLPDRTLTIGDRAGTLSGRWAKKLGLPAGIPVAGGALDAHLGAVGAGVKPGTLAKIMGTSGCDIGVAPLSAELPDIPGLCGIVPESVLPGCHGLEAGQAAFGDIYNWFVQRIQPGGPEAGSHEALTRDAEKLRPGESGLLALDWHNGNRTVLIDPRLTGAVIGLTLHTSPAEMYRSWIEATAFGSRAIVDRFEEYNVPIERVVNAGGISAKNRLVMQIFADVLNRPLEVSRSAQTCALGAAMSGAVVGGAHPTFAEATAAMTGSPEDVFHPIPENAAVYKRLYRLYKRLHDLFGTKDYAENQFGVMKELLDLRDSARNPESKSAGGRSFS